MDLPFVLFIPFGRGGAESNRRIPPASLQLPSRTAETCYELVVTVWQNGTEQKKFATPVPMLRYDTLSTFGMYNRPESAEMVSDHLVTLGISLPRWSYGPLDPVSIYIKLSPNPDWIKKATRVTIQKITIAIEEEITYNPEGDEPTKKINRISKQTHPVGQRLPATGYIVNLGLVFPAKENRDAEGIVKRGKAHFPMYAVNSFTTTGSLYKIEFFLIVKVREPLSSFSNPFDTPSCLPLEFVHALDDETNQLSLFTPSKENLNTYTLYFFLISHPFPPVIYISISSHMRS